MNPFRNVPINTKKVFVMGFDHQGYKTNTTKERLNGIPGVCIQQKKGVWYLNGKEMLDGWNKV